MHKPIPTPRSLIPDDEPKPRPAIVDSSTSDQVPAISVRDRVRVYERHQTERSRSHLLLATTLSKRPSKASDEDITTTVPVRSSTIVHEHLRKLESRLQHAVSNLPAPVSNVARPTMRLCPELSKSSLRSRESCPGGWRFTDTTPKVTVVAARRSIEDLLFAPLRERMERFM